MIEAGTAITLFCVGGGFALVCTLFGVIVRSAWMSRKLAPKKQPKVTP